MRFPKMAEHSDTQDERFPHPEGSLMAERSRVD
jgi:hypothetical protein